MIRKNPVYIIQSGINIAKWFLYEPKLSILLTDSIVFLLAKHFGKYSNYLLLITVATYLWMYSKNLLLDM